MCLTKCLIWVFAMFREAVFLSRIVSRLVYARIKSSSLTRFVPLGFLEITEGFMRTAGVVLGWGCEWEAITVGGSKWEVTEVP